MIIKRASKDCQSFFMRQEDAKEFVMNRRVRENYKEIVQTSYIEFTTIIKKR